MNYLKLFTVLTMCCLQVDHASSSLGAIVAAVLAKKVAKNFDRDLDIQLEKVYEKNHEKDFDYDREQMADDDYDAGDEEDYGQGNGGDDQNGDQFEGRKYRRRNGQKYPYQHERQKQHGDRKRPEKHRSGGRTINTSKNSASTGFIGDLVQLFGGKSLRVSFKKAPKHGHGGFGFLGGGGAMSGNDGVFVNPHGRYGRGLSMWRMHHLSGLHQNGGGNGGNGRSRLRDMERDSQEEYDDDYDQSADDQGRVFAKSDRDRIHHDNRRHTSSKQHRHGQGDAHEHAHGHGAHHGDVRNVDNFPNRE